MHHYQVFLFLLIITLWQTSQAENNSDKKETLEAKNSPKSSNYMTKNAPQVDVYYAGWDPHSHKALKFFQDHHIVVNAYDIEMDTEAAIRKKKLAPDFTGIPLVIINGIVIRGVDEQKYQDALHPIKPPEYK